jgi:hypothetical protein
VHRCTAQSASPPRPLQKWAAVIDKHEKELAAEDVAIAYSRLGDLTGAPQDAVAPGFLASQLDALDAKYSAAASTIDAQMLGPGLQSANQLVHGGGTSGMVRRLLARHGARLQAVTLGAACKRLDGEFLGYKSIQALENLVKVCTRTFDLSFAC